MYSVCVMKHLLECGVVALLVLEEPLIGELRLGQGLSAGLDVRLLEVVVLGLITCVEVGLISRVQLTSKQSTQCYYCPQGCGRKTGWTMRRCHHANINSRVEVHVRCVEGALGLGGHVVIGVVRLVDRFYHADVIPSTGFFPSGFCSSLLYL